MPRASPEYNDVSERASHPNITIELASGLEAESPGTAPARVRLCSCCGRLCERRPLRVVRKRVDSAPGPRQPDRNEHTGVRPVADRPLDRGHLGRPVRASPDLR